MARMVILLNSVYGQENTVVREVEKYNPLICMKVFGAYDIIVEIEDPTLDVLRDISFKIRKIKGVRSHLNLMVIEEKK